MRQVQQRSRQLEEQVQALQQQLAQQQQKQQQHEQQQHSGADAGSKPAPSAGAGAPDMSAVLEMMEGQLARLSAIIREREAEIAALRTTVQGCLDERRGLVAQLDDAQRRLAAAPPLAAAAPLPSAPVPRPVKPPPLRNPKFR
eukprot:49884-Chlamydomonas_euryale.AAC.1